MKKLKKILFFTVLFISLVSPLDAGCDYSDGNVDICESVGGNVSGGLTGPGGHVDTKKNFWSTNAAVMTKFSLVNQNTLEVKGIYYYAKFKEGEKTYGMNFVSDSGNAAGAYQVCGFISGGKTTSACASVNSGSFNIKGITYGNVNGFIVVDSQNNQYVSTSRLESWMKNEEGEDHRTYGREGWYNLYAMLIKLGVCDVSEFGLSGKCGDNDTLRDAIQHMTPQQNAEISQYLIIAEPVYANKSPNTTTPIMYSTLKGTARWMADRTPAGETRGIARSINTIHRMLASPDDYGLIRKYNNEFSGYGTQLTKDQWEALSDATNGSQYNIWALSTIFKFETPICEPKDTDEDGILEFYGRYGQVVANEQEMIEDCSCYVDSKGDYYLDYWSDPVSKEEWQEVCDLTDKFVCDPKPIDYDNMIDDCEDNSDNKGDMKDPEICRIINREYENKLEQDYSTEYGNSTCSIYCRETLEFTFMNKETALAGQSFSHSVESKYLNLNYLSTVILSSRQCTAVIDYDTWKRKYDSANDSVLSTWNNLKYWESLYNLAGGNPTEVQPHGGTSGCNGCSHPDHPTNIAIWETGYWTKTNDDGSTESATASVTQHGVDATCPHNVTRCSGSGTNRTCRTTCEGTSRPAQSADLGYVTRMYNQAINSYEGALDERERLMYELMDCNFMNSKNQIHSKKNYDVSNGRTHTPPAELRTYEAFLKDFPDPTVDIEYEETTTYSYEYDIAFDISHPAAKVVSDPVEISKTFSKETEWKDYCGGGVESEEACENDLRSLTSISYDEPLKYWLCSGATCRDMQIQFPINTIVSVVVDKEFGYYQDEDFYTQVYTGQVRNTPSSLGYWIPLDEHIYPVGIQRLTGDYEMNVYYDDINASNRKVQFEFNYGELYCAYHVINDLSKFKCDDNEHECYDCVGSDECYPKDESGNPIDVGVYFRTVDLTDVFPNSQYSPSTTNTLPSVTRRNIGQNWTTSNAIQVINEIQELGNKVWQQPYQYKVTLTPASIKAIQKSNKLKEAEFGYLDYSLINCSSSLHCESNFLKNELKEILGNKYDDLYQRNTREGLYDYRIKR